MFTNRDEINYEDVILRRGQQQMSKNCVLYSLHIYAQVAVWLVSITIMSSNN